MIDDARPPLDAAALRAGLGPPWTRLDVVDTTESTNADLLGAAPGSVLVAEYQQAGRGRLDRSWSSPPRAGLTFSAVVRSAGPPARWGWLPLLSAVATSAAIEAVTGVPVVLKWPNDLLAATGDGAKLAGILVQISAGTAVIGVGLNVTTTADELALPAATSLALAGARTTDRTRLLGAILAELGATYLRWGAAGADARACGLIAAYRRRCATIGRDVQVATVAGVQRAHAVDVDDDGRLVVRLADGGELGGVGETRPLAAADIVHLRTTGPVVG